MSRSPDYRLKILNKKTDEQNISAGAGWENEGNSISIVISPGVWLTNNKNLVYTLFPIEKQKEDL